MENKTCCSGSRNGGGGSSRGPPRAARSTGNPVWEAGRRGAAGRQAAGRQGWRQSEDKAETEAGLSQLANGEAGPKRPGEMGLEIPLAEPSRKAGHIPGGARLPVPAPVRGS